ncbi:MAG: hypothetical protein JWP34_5133 [Massilia sp.]|nr:hypothetical protein [Massilia sp.]
MSISALRKLLSSSSSCSSHASITTLAPHSGTRRDRVALFGRLATFLSTGTSAAAAETTHHDIATLLRSYLTQSQHAPVLSSLRALLVSPVVDSIAAAVQRAPDRDRRQLTSLVAPHYPRKTLNAMNFPISSTSYTTAQRHARTVGEGAPSPPPPLPPSKQPPSPAMMHSLTTFLDAHSQPAACRTVKVKGVVTVARILSHTHAELHREWKEEGNDGLLSLSAFIRAVKSLCAYKPISKRATDMCDHCVEGRHHDHFLTKRLDQHQPSCSFVSAIRSVVADYQSCTNIPPPVPAASSLPSCTCAVLTQTDRDATAVLLAPVCFYHHHRALKDLLHAEYKRQQTEIQDGEVIITLDYKQNIKLNVGPEEASRLFYHQAHRTVLGFLLQYRDPNTHALCNHYVDFISSCLTHDATFALECLRQVITRFLLPLRLHKLHVWCDRGPHFNCYEFLAGVTCTLPSEFPHLALSTDFSFFAEKHGKSMVDGHFSLLSRWVKQAAAQQHLVTNDDLLSALRAQADSHLQALRSESKPTHNVTFLLHTPSCVEHSSGEHDTLLPSSSDNSVQPSSPALGGDALALSGSAAVSQPSMSSDTDEPAAANMPELDDDGDVCMSPQQVSNPSSSPSTLSSATSAAAAAVCLSQGENVSDDEVAFDWDESCDQQGGVSAGRDVDVDVLMEVDTAPSRQPVNSGRTIPKATHSDHQQYGRAEGRVHCTRPPSLIPSLNLPTKNQIKLSTHYHWRAESVPVPPCPHPTAISSTFNTTSSSVVSSSSMPPPPPPSPPCSVTLVASVVPHSSVWPEQSICAEYSLKPSSKQTISFAPRLQAVPVVVVHKNCISAMQNRLTSLQKVFPTMSFKQALSIVQSITDNFTAYAQQWLQPQSKRSASCNRW